jgi:hypothetical protein
MSRVPATTTTKSCAYPFTLYVNSLDLCLDDPSKFDLFPDMDASALSRPSQTPHVRSAEILAGKCQLDKVCFYLFWVDLGERKGVSQLAHVSSNADLPLPDPPAFCLLDRIPLRRCPKETRADNKHQRETPIGRPRFCTHLL